MMKTNSDETTPSPSAGASEAAARRAGPKNGRHPAARPETEHGEAGTTTTKHGATVQRDELGHFLPGQSGNPNGRPPGGPVVDFREAVLEGAERDGVDLLELVWRCVAKHLELGAAGSLASATWATNRLAGLLETVAGRQGGPALAVQINNGQPSAAGGADRDPAASSGKVLEVLAGLDRLRQARGDEPLVPGLTEALEAADSTEDGNPDGNDPPRNATTNDAEMTYKSRPPASLANPGAEGAAVVEAESSGGPSSPAESPPGDASKDAPEPRSRSTRRSEAPGGGPATGTRDAAQTEIEEILS